MSPLLGTIPVAIPDPMHLEGWEENDEPLASDFHLWEQDRCYDVLRTLYAGPRCYVSMNRWLAMGAHWPHPLQPDLLVALGVPHRNRDVYDPALEGKPPDLLAEYLSPRSQTGDLGEKLRLYALVGAREFWVFNPSGRFALPRIQGCCRCVLTLTPGTRRRSRPALLAIRGLIRWKTSMARCWRPLWSRATTAPIDGG